MLTPQINEQHLRSIRAQAKTLRSELSMVDSFADFAHDDFGSLCEFSLAMAKVRVASEELDYRIRTYLSLRVAAQEDGAA